MAKTQCDELGTVDINGPLRVEELADGWYAIGRGCSSPAAIAMRRKPSWTT